MTSLSLLAGRTVVAIVTYQRDNIVGDHSTKQTPYQLFLKYNIFDNIKYGLNISIFISAWSSGVGHDRADRNKSLHA